MSGEWPVAWVRERLGYEPRDPTLFAFALTHRSAPGSNNERLEFLGDAVLNLVIAEHVYRVFPDATEGDLSRVRARIVSRAPLAAVATDLGIDGILKMGAGELKSGGARRDSVLENAIEALCGAVFLDGGLEAARAMIERFFAPRIAALPALDALKDAKTRLQEYLQSRGLPLPRYSVERVEGEPHQQQFFVMCHVKALSLSAGGTAASRRSAEQEAAAGVLREIGLSP